MMIWQWGDVVLAVAALVGLVAVMIQFGFEMADVGSPPRPYPSEPQEHEAPRLKKAA